ncbi:DUF4055 domain-containing protein [Pseudomonas nitroreducens]|uniref:DUF4055 domain-containing protein n=1 Tax=Pseudomonas nitroreducens TaxID=46680 RepID=UPI00351D69A9
MAYDVTYQRPEYLAAMRWRWPMVRDICAGSECVKAKKETYLPKPNATDESEQNKARYKAYVQRAVFFNATGGTKKGLIGAVFRVVPTLTVPTLLQYVAKDIDGAGNSIYQQSQSVLGQVLESGRAFLLADYPKVEGGASRADQQSGRIRSTLTAYDAQDVINWDVQKIGAEHILSLVVIRECLKERDGFGYTEVEQYRVLEVVNGIYTVTLWRQTSGGWESTGAVTPLRSNGKPWDRIPGTFVGAENNDVTVDEAPLYDLAELNLGHYHNSADYEDAAYLVGQPQVYMAGLDDQWVEMLEKKGIYFGSRAILPLPVNGSAGILQAQPNTMVKEAMDAKERQMVALGARLIERGSATKTATQADAENAAEHSVLSLVASNVSEAYTKALGWMGEFEGATGTAEYKLNQDFVEASLDAQMLTALVGAWQANALAQSDLFRLLRKFDLVNPEKTDEQLLEELDTSPAGLNLDNADGNVAATG